jgi:class 3 adenylate cyclase/tetratricopeptide (TPR) repeat protein
MRVCPSCGHANRDGAKFCEECATPLGTPLARGVAEERKIVTALFCDLVGFTVTSESADPEDVATMLTAYFEMARKQIESHGGVVEKFIGDAVVGVFGVPAAHEDDPERAVRAGLRIVEDAERLEALGGAPLRLRVGINTGEALVRLGVRAGSGEGFVTGDSINTASRIQSVAPEMGVVVGVATYDTTSAVFEYEELEPVTLKGKSDLVRIFHATSAKARSGTGLTGTQDSPFIGREIDLALLKSLFDKAVAAREVKVVTVVGGPGLGKSRIVAELFAYVDARPELINWRQGRCLPYGDGITFWALGEIVKAHAGILGSDAADVASTKLDAILPEGDERAWFRQRLSPLLGIEATSLAERDELFTAWRRFLELIAQARPTVLVFEDLHWAGEAMIAFIDHLANRVTGVPLLVVCTTRPELFERYGENAVELSNASVINLSPLSPEEITRLVSARLQVTKLPAELERPLLDLVDGNPFYAEEFVRLLRDRDLLFQNGSGWALREGAEIPFPDSVQALIAARLDTLSPDAKAMLASAAVVGKVFWAGAVAAMGQRDLNEVFDVLRELSRKELVRPVRSPSIEGEAEFAFWHILTRDVAYAQLPRASRATSHVSAAAWIESKAAQRTEDLADVLAYHYATALDLARATGKTEEADELEAPALRFLCLAGERALGLDNETALASFEQALALAPPGHPDRAEALARFGQAAKQAGRFVEASEALEEAARLFRARGDLPATARTMVMLSRALSGLADPRSWTLPMEAWALIERLPPDNEAIEVLTEVAGSEAVQGRSDAGIQHADRALVLAADLGQVPPARALGFRGFARSALGDAEGLDDMREAIGLATRAGLGAEAALILNNLGAQLWMFEGPAASQEVLREGVAFAKQRGLVEYETFIMAGTLDNLIDVGKLDEALEVAAGLAEPFEAADDVVSLAAVRAAETRIHAMRGKADQIVVSLDWLESTLREAGNFMVVGLWSSALARAALGQDDRAAALLTEVASAPGAREVGYYVAFLPGMVRTAQRLGNQELAKRLTDDVEPLYPYAEHALVAASGALAEERGDFRNAAVAHSEAADRWEQFGVVPEQAFALLGEGRCLVRLGRPTDATPVLKGAHEIFERLQAAPALAETDTLLQQASR